MRYAVCAASSDNDMTRFRLVFPSRLLAALTFLSGASPARATACGCEDVRDLRNRICEARAAISEYGRQINRISRYEKNELKQPLMYTESLYKTRMQPCVQEAINTVTDSGARRPTADTNNSCEISLKGNPTACMAESLNTHERYHVRACMQRREIRTEGSAFKEFAEIFRDSRSGQSLISLANEERSAYSGEIEHNLSKLNSLAARCPKAMFEINRPGGGREFTIDYCPPPRPRPSPEESSCPQTNPPRATTPPAAPPAAPPQSFGTTGG